jgi:tocopherol O-methyltransferase
VTREQEAMQAEPRVARWYADKTEDILRKYGPGPRVHYHTGIVDPWEDATESLEDMRARLLAGQERLLETAADAWQAPINLCGDVLDVGCGLGGGSLFWAQSCGARVVALTNVAEHAGIIEGFASRAGVSDRVTPVVGDASTTPAGGEFDAVVAIESSCYLPRARWMRHVAELLRPGGHLFISDIFAKRDEARLVFDCDWLMTIGSRAEYERHAEAAGLVLCSVHDLTGVTRTYWVLSMDYHRAIRDTQPQWAERAARSIVRHARVLSAWESGAIGCELVAFRRP